jgi:hypothetical protein
MLAADGVSIQEKEFKIVEERIEIEFIVMRSDQNELDWKNVKESKLSLSILSPLSCSALSMFLNILR